MFFDSEFIGKNLEILKKIKRNSMQKKLHLNRNKEPNKRERQKIASAELFAHRKHY